MITDIINFHKNIWIENRKWFRSILIWFVVALLLGAVAFYYYSEMLAQVLKIFEDKFGENPALNFHLALEIFKNNLIASFSAIVGGLLLGILPFFVVVSNGFIIGYILMSVISLNNAHLSESLLFLGVGLIPHGIIEIPAFFLASALGLRLGLNWLSKDSAGKRGSVFKKDFIYVLKCLPILIIMLFVAAIIEVFVTGKLLGS